MNTTTEEADLKRRLAEAYYLTEGRQHAQAVADKLAEVMARNVSRKTYMDALRARVAKAETEVAEAAGPAKPRTLWDAADDARVVEVTEQKRTIWDTRKGA